MRPTLASTVLLLLACCCAPIAPARAQDVMALVRADRWAEADAAAARAVDPVARKLVLFYRLLTPGAASVQEIADFMAASPDWPAQPTLARRRDEALAAEPDDFNAAALCDRYRPTLSGALERCAQVDAVVGRSADAAALARAAWVGTGGDLATEMRFLQRWGGVLTQDDEQRRFDRLVQTDVASAARQAARLDPPARRIAELRLALRGDDPQAGAAFAALHDKDRTDPWLLLDAARWLRHANDDDAAQALWLGPLAAAEQAVPADRRAVFWQERNVLIRRRLRQGDAAAAYALAAGHAQTVGEPALDAEFLAGFIALRRLGDAAKATPHFRRLAEMSGAAITQARAHYWLARAAADPAAAHAEYAAAAAWPSTFYGQLAALALDPDPADLAAAIRAHRDPPADAAIALDFAGRELARAAALLTGWGEPRRAITFLLRLDEIAPDAVDRSLAARLAAGLGDPSAAVFIARRAGRDGQTLLDTGWPAAATVPADPGVEPAVALGVIRQESSFDPTDVSPTGARGLMQLMPATATTVARRVGVAAPVAALTVDADLNIRLGTTYLRGLLDQFGGALPLAIAAYNAGPGRVVEWLGVNGDPRDAPTEVASAGGPVPAGAGIDMIDWIELIPFGETRNYVQRVIENIEVYRARNGDVRPYPLAPWRP
jgi:soluble lytic murein transglycosylase